MSSSRSVALGLASTATLHSPYVMFQLEPSMGAKLWLRAWSKMCRPAFFPASLVSFGSSLDH